MRFRHFASLLLLLHSHSFIYTDAAHAISAKRIFLSAGIDDEDGLSQYPTNKVVNTQLYDPSNDPNQYRYYSASGGSAGGAGQVPPQLNPLLKQANTASVGILFGLLIWRSLTAYELAEQFTNATFRMMTVVPAVFILCSNVIGFIVNLLKPLNFKNHLKLILAVNIIREWIELAYNLATLVVNTSTAKETAIGRIFMNLWWSFLCFSFSKSRWVMHATHSMKDPMYEGMRQPYFDYSTPSPAAAAAAAAAGGGGGSAASSGASERGRYRR